MIAVRETEDGKIERISGNPVLLSLDGRVKAPLRTILHESWTADDRAAFGVYVVEPATVPEGKRAVGAPTYERRDGAVVEVCTVEDIPPPDIKRVMGEMDERAKTLPAGTIVLVGLDYAVAISGEQVTIGCEVHTAAEWSAFDDRAIAAMDGLKGSRFWAEHRDVILKLAGVL